MVHSVRTILDLHLDWVVLQVDVCNALNLMLQSIIF
jgi:hypothetical protein